MAALAAAATLVLGLGARPAGASSSPTVSGPDESDLVTMTNAARASYGLGPLVDDIAARNVARAWALWMASARSLQHNPYLSSQVSQSVTSSWTHLGENVGYGPNVSTIQSMFMASSAHRSNILGSYNRVGIGAYRDTSGNLWVSVVFINGPPIPYVSPSTWSPFSNPYWLVDRQFRDFTGYPGTVYDEDWWATTLRAGTGSGAAVATAVMNAPPAQAALPPVARLYYAYFLRMPDYGGLAFWAGSIHQGMPLSSVSDAFAASKEFKDLYGSLSNKAFVDLVYRNVLDRAPDSGGKAFWLDALNSGLARGDMMLGFSESPEFKADKGADVIVITAYAAMLHRVPDSYGFGYWRGAIAAGTPAESLTGAILYSAEYADLVT